MERFSATLTYGAEIYKLFLIELSTLKAVDHERVAQSNTRKHQVFPKSHA